MWFYLTFSLLVDQFYCYDMFRRQDRHAHPKSLWSNVSVGTDGRKSSRKTSFTCWEKKEKWMRRFRIALEPKKIVRHDFSTLCRFVKNFPYLIYYCKTIGEELRYCHNINRYTLLNQDVGTKKVIRFEWEKIGLDRLICILIEIGFSSTCTKSEWTRTRDGL